MRVLNRADFLKMPEGTIYAKGQPWAFGGLEIKAQTWGNDWVCLDPCWIEADDSGAAFYRLDDMLKNGSSYPCEDAFGRDGGFDEKEVFLVFERDDLLALKAHIDMALTVAE